MGESKDRPGAAFGGGRGEVEGEKRISLEKMVQSSDSKASYQGLRHLMPSNLSPLRALIERESGRAQLDSLKEVNRLSPLQPPFVHRPDSRYVSSIMVSSDTKGNS